MLLQNLFNTGVADAKSEAMNADEKVNTSVISSNDSSKQEFNNALKSSIISRDNNNKNQTDSAKTSSNYETSGVSDNHTSPLLQAQQQQHNTQSAPGDFNTTGSSHQHATELKNTMAAAAQNNQTGNTLPENGTQNSASKADAGQQQAGQETHISADKTAKNDSKLATEVAVNQQGKVLLENQKQQVEGRQGAVVTEKIQQDTAQQGKTPDSQEFLNQAKDSKNVINNQAANQTADLKANIPGNPENKHATPGVRSESSDGKQLAQPQTNQTDKMLEPGIATKETTPGKASVETSQVKAETAAVIDSQAKATTNQTTSNNQLITDSPTGKEAVLPQNVTQSAVKSELEAKARKEGSVGIRAAESNIATGQAKADRIVNTSEQPQVTGGKSDQPAQKVATEVVQNKGEKIQSEFKMEARAELELQKPSKASLNTDVLKTRLSALSSTATTHLASMSTQQTGSLSTPSGQPITYAAPDSVSSQTSTSVMAKDSALPVSLPRNQWNQRFAERISMLTLKGNSHARIRLDPPELGPMSVRILHQGADTQIHFTVNNPVARELVDSGLQRLREMLEEHGFSSVNVDVNEYRQGQAQGQSEHDDLDELDIEHLSQWTAESTEANTPIESYRDNIGIIDIFA